MAWIGPFLLLFSALLMELAAQSSKGINLDERHDSEELSPFRVKIISEQKEPCCQFPFPVIPLEHRVSSGESKILQPLERNEQLCTLCEEYTALATDYLNANKTETEIMVTLHQACSQLHSFEQQCMILVDYYGQLFFSEIARIRPEEFCRKVNLCERISAPLLKRDDTCMLCHLVVTEVLAKLKDPDSQLEIIQILLKECNKMDHYAKECKRLVFRYGPLIFANGEKFLESTDICSSIHACKANQEDGEPAIIAESLVLDA